MMSLLWPRHATRGSVWIDQPKSLNVYTTHKSVYTEDMLFCQTSSFILLSIHPLSRQTPPPHNGRIYGNWYHSIPLDKHTPSSTCSQSNFTSELRANSFIIPSTLYTRTQISSSAQDINHNYPMYNMEELADRSQMLVSSVSQSVSQSLGKFSMYIYSRLICPSIRLLQYQLPHQHLRCHSG